MLALYVQVSLEEFSDSLTVLTSTDRLDNDSDSLYTLYTGTNTKTYI